MVLKNFKKNGNDKLKVENQIGRNTIGSHKFIHIGLFCRLLLLLLLLLSFFCPFFETNEGGIILYILHNMYERITYSTL